jgi:hypothetical protein
MMTCIAAAASPMLEITVSRSSEVKTSAMADNPKVQAEATVRRPNGVSNADVRGVAGIAFLVSGSALACATVSVSWSGLVLPR